MADYQPRRASASKARLDAGGWVLEGPAVVAVAWGSSDMIGGFDVEALLAPLPDGTGPDLRGGGGGEPNPFLTIKDARGEARLAERDALASGDPDRLPLMAGLRAWEAVASGAQRLLAETSKDLQVAAWLTEAWLRTDGFPGVAAGFALLAGLVERFWDEGLHPQEDEDGVETRVQPLFGLFGQSDVGALLQPLKLLPLSDAGGAAVALWTVETAQALSVRHEDPEVAEQLVERRAAQIEAMERAIGDASPEFAAAAQAGIADALAALNRLMAQVDARTPFGRFGTQVAGPLRDAATLLRVHGPGAQTDSGVDDVPSPAASIADDPAGDAPSAPAPAANAPAPAAAMDRERALATLLEVAAFFERNEPQSLVASSLRNVVRRATLPAETLLAELLPDAEQRALFLLRAGIGGGEDNNGF